MKIMIYTLVFLFIAQNSYTQTSSYRDTVEMQLDQTRKGNRVYRDKDTAAKRLYFFDKRKKQIAAVVLAPHGSHSAYHYDFINDVMVRMELYLPYSASPESNGKPMRGIYYFRNGSLVDKIEINFPTLNIEEYRKSGIELYNRALLFLKKKRIG